MIGAPDADLFQPAGIRGRAGRQLLRDPPPVASQLPRPHRGLTFGITEDCTDLPRVGAEPGHAALGGRRQLARLHGRDAEPLLHAGPKSGDYAKKHNPFMYFPSVTSDPSLCARDVPETRLRADLDSSAAAGLCLDQPRPLRGRPRLRVRLGGRIPAQGRPAAARPARTGRTARDHLRRGDDATRGCCGNASGGRIATVLLGPAVRRGRPPAQSPTRSTRSSPRSRTASACLACAMLLRGPRARRGVPQVVPNFRPNV